MTDAYLEIAGLTKSYDGKRKALDRVSLTAREGEFVTFLGPSGSGKTTTLMVIAGFEQPDGGEVRVGGVSMFGVPPHKRGIGVVFQNYALFPHRTALQNVMFPLLMRSVPKAQAAAKAKEMLALVGLADYGERYPRQLSGGQQQRVALARALVFDPTLLLLDEPLGALDKNLREQMQLEIKRIQRALHVTTVFVTHDQSEAMALSDRIVVFEGGRIQQDAAPLDVYLRPCTEFVARFIGDSNLLKARIVDAGAGIAEVEGLGLSRVLPEEARALPGGEALLLLRPEVLTPAEADHVPNRLVLAVEEIVQFGDSALVIGRAGGVALRARLPGRDAQGIEAGAQLPLCWRTDAGHLIGS
ncbi:ABC transporter ATP-binding protein [Falsiroseomonas sp. HW251]|uniref:ABC transporter ATP-binding protein n=1 Tax=Falsiroseomonas sp. HW251 TaxID=3390998 RepID=UPI003D312D34